MQLQCLFANLMICSLIFKTYVFLKNVAWDLELLLLPKSFDFEVKPNLSCYFISIMDKTHHGPVIALFFVKLKQLCLVMWEVS